jgi:vacuolar-type H+-ATPase subunit F/Vma7
MSEADNIFAIGERERVRALALAGVQVLPADDAEAARAAWQALPEEFGLVILTTSARDAVAPSEKDRRLWVVIPE